MELRELLRDYVNRDYNELWQEAYDSWKVMKPYFDRVADDGDGTYYIISFIGSSLVADGKLTALETKLVCDMFDVSEETVRNVFRKTDRNVVTLVDRVFDEMLSDTKIKAAVLSFVTCFLAVDETISVDEIAFVQRLLD